MLDFATLFLKVGVTNNQSFAYDFVGNLLLYLKHRKFFDDIACVKRYGCCKPTWVLDA